MSLEIESGATFLVRHGGDISFGAEIPPDPKGRVWSVQSSDASDVAIEQEIVDQDESAKKYILFTFRPRREGNHTLIFTLSAPGKPMLDDETTVLHLRSLGDADYAAEAAGREGVIRS